LGWDIDATASFQENTVNVRVRLALLALTATPLVGAAADEPKLSCVKDFTYSQDFLNRHPKAGAACREVIKKGGQKWARFDARVVEMKGNQVTVKFIDTANQPVETLTFTAPPDARVVVRGQEMTYGALGEGDTLSFWLPESRVGFYSAPGASKLTEIKVARADER
jgi:hypothetical protein